MPWLNGDAKGLAGRALQYGGFGLGVRGLVELYMEALVCLRGGEFGGLELPWRPWLPYAEAVYKGFGFGLFGGRKVW